MAIKRTLDIASGIGIGAAMMYLFDPVRGARRRSLLRDQGVRFLTKSARAADVARRDMLNRAYGAYAKSLSVFQSRDDSDEKLVQRVRSKIGRYVSHPSSIKVTAHDGHVTVSGPILAHEVGELLMAVQSVPGVREVENRLESHRSPENVSSLQGGVPRSGEPREWMQESWSPTARVLAGAAGMALMADCIASRNLRACMTGTLGFGLFVRAATNTDFRTLLGLGEGRGLDIQKTITIHAPVEQVYELLANPENHLSLTDKLKSAKRVADDRYQKTFAGPLNMSIVSEEMITAREPNQRIAWQSTENSSVQFAGEARFESLGHDRTRVAIHMRCKPPAGMLGHALARLMGCDAKSELDDLLMRAKSYLETGRRPHDAVAKLPAEDFQSRSTMIG